MLLVRLVLSWLMPASTDPAPPALRIVIAPIAMYPMTHRRPTRLALIHAPPARACIELASRHPDEAAGIRLAAIEAGA
jgi:hypothetical protein